MRVDNVLFLPSYTFVINITPYSFVILDWKQRKMSGSKLNKELYTEVNKLKNLNIHTQPKFILDQSPFPDDDDDQGAGAAAATNSKEIVIVGRILPDSEIYNQGAYSIEMKLTPNYPFDPPEVRFLTKIYHPNVAEDGKND